MLLYKLSSGLYQSRINHPLHENQTKTFTFSGTVHDTKDLHIKYNTRHHQDLGWYLLLNCLHLD